MAHRDECLQQNASLPIDEHFLESEDGVPQPESPGMQKLQELTTIQFDPNESEVPAKLMQRPISSGSTELRDYTYGTAPKRDLHIAKKNTTALYGVAHGELHAEGSAAKPIMGNVLASQSHCRRRLECQTFTRA